MATSTEAPAYAELQCRTHYSFLRGASHPHELMDRARALGLHALAITDRHGVYGVPKAYVAWKAQPEPRPRLIVGAELAVELAPGRVDFVTLLARDRAGYGLMCRLLTASHAGRPKGEGRLPWRELLERATAHPGRAGLVALARLGRAELGGLGEVFRGSVYVPVTRALEGRSDPETHGFPGVATMDVHYHARERRPLHDTLVAIREGVPVREAGFHLFSNAERHLKSPAQMARLFRDRPELVRRTVEIAASCSFSPAELRYRYPSEWIPPGASAQGHLEALTWRGAGRRYAGRIPPDVDRQLRHELRLIAELGFADYFLTIWDIVDFARRAGILCQGRGSAANSVVCYCLEITAIDPVRMNLLFERFISAERGEPPDIDVDFEHERREEVIQYIYDKYGRERAGMVAAVISYRDKSSLNEVTKALGEGHPRAGALLEEIEGFPRHLSIHSGGFTLSADPLIETVPIEPARMEGRTIVQWDKGDLAAIGLLKVDVLALGMLSALRKAMDHVNAHGAWAQPGQPMTLASIPADDGPTYDMICRGETVGVFQIESRAQIGMLKRLLPRNFYDLVVEIAIVRPGPIVGQMVHPYLRRRRGLESSKSPHPRLEPILGRTRGVPLFQEQVMKMAVEFAGFTPGESDELRRAIGSWRSSGSIEKMGRKLQRGLLASGLPPEFVDRVFAQIKGFSEYGFPESHAASFALLAYASSYLKRHHPAEFACALINSQPMGFYASHTLVDELKRAGGRVLALDPNVSAWDCTLEGGALRMGWRMLSGLREADHARIAAARARGAFTGVGDFVRRTALPWAPLERLALGGGFDALGVSPRDALWEILGVRALAAREAEGEQFSFFGPALAADAAEFRPLTALEAIQSDYEAVRHSVRGHPMAALRPTLPYKPMPLSSGGVKRAPGGRVVRAAGMVIVRQRPPTAKGTAFATLEDEEGFLDLILHKEVYERFRDVFRGSRFLLVRGRVQRDREAVSLIVRSLEALATGVEVKASSYDFH